MRIEAHELHGTDVKLVSLVKRGANRLPWRITKSEDGEMLNIASYFRTTKAADADAKPVIHSAIVLKAAKNFDSIVATLKKSGIDMSKPVEKDGFVVYAQKAGDPAPDATLLKSSGDVGFIVDNLSKSFSGYDFSSNEFNDVFATGSFCPSVAMASDLMGVTIGNILSSAESPAEAAGKIAKAVDGFKSYATTLATALPEQAFKADKLLKGDVGSSLADFVQKASGGKLPLPRGDGSAGSTDIKDAIDLGTVNDAGSGTQTDATADDKKAVFQGNPINGGKGGKLPIVPDGTPALKKAEALRKEAAEAAAAGDHGMATVLYKAADKLIKAATVVVKPGDNSLVVDPNQSGAGANSTDTGANVTKADQVTKEQVEAIIVALTKSAESYDKVGLKKRADAVREDIERLKKGETMVDGNGASAAATSDDAANTAVGDTKKGKRAPDPLHAGLTDNGQDWTAKIAEEFAKLTKAIPGMVTAAVDGVRKDVTGLAAQVTAINGRIEKAEEAVNGTVYAEPERRSNMLGFRATKSEGSEGSAPAPLDTGLRKWDGDGEDVNVRDIRKFAAKGRNW
jgi:hypothetical protein